MNAMYNNDRSIISESNLKIVNLEYIDTAELYEKLEHTKRVYIEQLSRRANAITIHIRLQKDFLNEFGKAYIPSLPDFKKYGHSIKWTNKEKFLKDIRRIEKSEKVYISKLEEEVKNLSELREKKEKKDVTVKYNRGDFVKLVIGIGKCGYSIDNDKTTMEEFAYMIKQQSDENKKK